MTINLYLEIISEKKITRVDNVWAVNILPNRTFLAIGLIQGHLKYISIIIQDSIKVLGKILIKTRLREIDDFLEFLVIDVDTAFNSLLGRPWMQKNIAVPCIYHQCIKYPLRGGQDIIKIDNDSFAAVEGYYTNTRYYKGQPKVV